MKKTGIPAVSPSGSAVKALGLLLLLAAIGSGTTSASDGDEHSPYLDMHRQDPVQWRQWGPQVLAEARRDNRPIFISVGYFSCYWCHVMQQESFVNADIAAILNKSYIPVIVDRELNPALDAQLLDFVERYRGSSGWPLNAILTPDGHPLLGTVYVPQQDFHKLLSNLAEQWPSQHQKMIATARQAARPVERPPAPSLADDRDVAKQFRERLHREVMALADEFNGGFGEPAKFPLSPLLQTLMHMTADRPTSDRGRFLQLTLDNMAIGNLRDHLRGGFFRYTIDPDWREPHFEKMLYDNAQLALVYLRAAKLFDRPDYRRVAFATLDFLNTYMRSPQGGFYAALSAVDTRGVDGGYYLWTEEALRTALGDKDYDYAKLAWPLPADPAAQHGLLPPVLSTSGNPRLLAIRDKLLAARPAGHIPADRKLLAGWNGLALAAFARAAALPEGRKYRATATTLRRYLVQQLWDGKTLYRMKPDHGTAVEGTLEDYAWVIGGLLQYDLLTGKPDHGIQTTMLEQARKRFYDAHGWQASAATLLPLPRNEVHLPSRHLPSASASLIRAGLELARRKKDRKLAQQWRDTLRHGRHELLARPFEYADYADLLDHLAVNP